MVVAVQRRGCTITQRVKNRGEALLPRGRWSKGCSGHARLLRDLMSLAGNWTAVGPCFAPWAVFACGPRGVLVCPAHGALATARWRQEVRERSPKLWTFSRSTFSAPLTHQCGQPVHKRNVLSLGANQITNAANLEGNPVLVQS